MKRIQALNFLRDEWRENAPLIFILGPCAIENESHTMQIAEHLKKLSEDLGFLLVFKASFDKANRTSIAGYRSIGMHEGLRILRQVRDHFDVPTLTDIHEPWQAAEAVHSVDILQTPAFLCRQTDLLEAAGKTGAIINIKKGQFFPAHAMKESAAKVARTGNKNIWLCERGFTFGYGDLIVDYRNFSIMKAYGYPVIFDATHAVQQPSSLGSSTGGDRRFVGDLAIAAVSQRIAGIFMETHEEPERALCDGPNSIRLSHLGDLIRYLIELDFWVKSKPVVSVW